jgi:hypothetical protein
MPLYEGSKEYIGKTLLVLPYYGHGWIRADLGTPPPEPHGELGPEPFRVRVENLISCVGDPVGAAGAIEQARHSFERYWCYFYLRTTDECDFTQRPGHYMIWIAPEKLPIQPAPDRALYEWITPERSKPVLCGYGMVAESEHFLAGC